MDAVVLALCSAALFGAMTVALRPALAHGGDPLPARSHRPACARRRARRGDDRGRLADLPASGRSRSPASSRRASLDRSSRSPSRGRPSRTSATVGMAPLFAVTFAVVLLDEPLVAGIVLGALLDRRRWRRARERARPPRAREGAGSCSRSTAAIASPSRDTLVRCLAVDTGVAPELAISATLPRER